VVRMGQSILLFDKTGRFVGLVKDGILLDEKGKKIREINDKSVKISELVKELARPRPSNYIA